MTDATRLIEAASAGDTRAAAELLPLLYDELRALAAAHIRHEAPNLTLQPTALVHEAYMRLIGPGDRWQSRGHFVAAAAEAMRRVLIDHARGKARQKRGGEFRRVDLRDVANVEDMPPDDLLDLDAALLALAEESPAKAELVKLRFYAGLTLEEAAEALDISEATAYRWWAYVRSWLLDRLQPADQ